jgi:hypothetical protein
VFAGGRRGVMVRRQLIQRRGVFIKLERRVFCSCELCRLRFGRLLYPRNGGMPLGLGQRKGRNRYGRDAS